MAFQNDSSTNYVVDEPNVPYKQLSQVSRVVALVLFANMPVAFVAGDHDALARIFSDHGKFYGARPYTFWFAVLLILIFGPGWIAIDTLLARRKSDHILNEKQNPLVQDWLELRPKAH